MIQICTQLLDILLTNTQADSKNCITSSLVEGNKLQLMSFRHFRMTSSSSTPVPMLSHSGNHCQPHIIISSHIHQRRIFTDMRLGLLLLSDCASRRLISRSTIFAANYLLDDVSYQSRIGDFFPDNGDGRPNGMFTASTKKSWMENG